MKKITLALSSLILSQSLATLTTPNVAHAHVVPASDAPTKSMVLIGTFSHEEKKYTLKLTLKRGEFFEDDSTSSHANQSFEMIGNMMVTDSMGRQLYSVNSADSDGAIVFQRTGEGEVFSGTYCSSTFSCNYAEELDPSDDYTFTLRHDAEQWTASLKTTFIHSWSNPKGDMTMNIDAIPMVVE